MVNPSQTVSICGLLSKKPDTDTCSALINSSSGRTVEDMTNVALFCVSVREEVQVHPGVKDKNTALIHTLSRKEEST